MISVATSEDLAVLRREVEQLREIIASARDWYTTRTSPLGARKTRRLIESGRLPAYRPSGRLLLIRRADLDAYILAHPITVAKPEPTRAELPEDVDTATYAEARVFDLLPKKKTKAA